MELIFNNKLNINHDKLMNTYFTIKNKKNLIKPLRKKFNIIDPIQLSNNINKFNKIINNVHYYLKQNNLSKIKKIIKNNFNINNNTQAKIALQTIKNISNINQKGGFIFLDIIGLIPAVGLPFDVISTIISLSQGDFFVTLLSAGAVIPGIGTFPGIGKIGVKLLKTFSNFSSFLPANTEDDDDEDYDDEDYDDKEYEDKPVSLINQFINLFGF